MVFGDRAAIFVADSKTEDYGKYAWMSTDGGEGNLESVIIAIYSLRQPEDRFSQVANHQIEFYKIAPKPQTNEYFAYELDFKLNDVDPSTLDKATFVNGDFLWQKSPSEGPSMIRVCPANKFLNEDTHLCEPCRYGFRLAPGA